MKAGALRFRESHEVMETLVSCPKSYRERVKGERGCQLRSGVDHDDGVNPPKLSELAAQNPSKLHKATYKGRGGSPFGVAAVPVV